jgi:hypothetical protein
MVHKSPNDTMNRGYQARWKLKNKSEEIEMYGCVHGVLINVPIYFCPVFKFRLNSRIRSMIFSS